MTEALRRQAERGSDLRGFIAYLDEHHPGEVLRVREPVDPIFGVTAALAKLEKLRRFPAVIWENVQGSRIPCVTNMHADYRRIALAFGLDADTPIQDFIREYAYREERPIEPVPHPDPARAPVKEVVLRGDEVDVLRLPVLKYHEFDAGRYITHGYTIMKDPDTGIPNAGIYRYMIKGRDKMGVQISETAHGNHIMKRYFKEGRDCEVAVIIGHHPAFNIGCLSITGIDTNEYAVAGAMMGRPVELVRCETVDVEVPADSEIVLECVISATEREPEAPFGEYPGTYGPERINPVVRVRAITMRRNPLYQSSFVGHPDNLLLSGICRCSHILKTVRAASPGTRAVYVPPCGNSRYICFVQMEKLIEGDPKNAAMAAFAADPFLKYVVVVDEDVDIMNDSAVWHAIANRVRFHTDAFVVTNSRGSPLDPASYDPAGGSHIVTKVGIDATRKPDYPLEISVPGTDEVDLSRYFGDLAEGLGR
jgi:2,5-furandicarboxylate decarboxylase 1